MSSQTHRSPQQQAPQQAQAQAPAAAPVQEPTLGPSSGADQATGPSDGESDVSDLDIEDLSALLDANRELTAALCQLAMHTADYEQTEWNTFVAETANNPFVANADQYAQELVWGAASTLLAFLGGFLFVGPVGAVLGFLIGAAISAWRLLSGDSDQEIYAQGVEETVVTVSKKFAELRGQRDAAVSSASDAVDPIETDLALLRLHLTNTLVADAAMQAAIGNGQIAMPMLQIWVWQHADEVTQNSFDEPHGDASTGAKGETKWKEWAYKAKPAAWAWSVQAMADLWTHQTDLALALAGVRLVDADSGTWRRQIRDGGFALDDIADMFDNTYEVELLSAARFEDWLAQHDPGYAGLIDSAREQSPAALRGSLFEALHNGWFDGEVTLDLKKQEKSVLAEGWDWKLDVRDHRTIELRTAPDNQ